MVAIVSTTSQLKLDEVVVALFSEKIRRKSSEVAKETLITQGRVKDKSKQDMKPESSGKDFKVKCWNYGKTISERIAKRRRRKRRRRK